MRVLQLCTRTRRRKVALGAVVLLATAGAGMAAWLTTVDSPPARGKFVTLTVTKSAPVAAGGAACLPGNPCDGTIRLNNTNGAPLTLTGFTAAGASGTAVINSGGGGACIPNDITGAVAIPAKTGLAIPVPVGSSDIVIPGLFSVSATLISACAGVDFTLTPPAGGFVATLTT